MLSQYVIKTFKVVRTRGLDFDKERSGNSIL